MQHPQVIVTGQDDTLANQLQSFINEHRWRLLHVADAEKARPSLGCPTVLLVQLDVEDAKAKAQNTMSHVHLVHPDVAIIAVLSSKISSDERAIWLAGLFDLGARYVLIPPHTRSVVEDVVGGLMTATIARITGATIAEDVVDLADEESIQ